MQLEHVVPGPHELPSEVEVSDRDEDGVHGNHVEEAEREVPPSFGVTGKVDGKHVGFFDGALGALIEDVEVTDRLDLVSPELDPHGLGSPEREDVQNAPTDGELADFFHDRDALETPRLERLDQREETGRIPSLDRESKVGEATGEGCPLL